MKVEYKSNVASVEYESEVKGVTSDTGIVERDIADPSTEDWDRNGRDRVGLLRLKIVGFRWI